MGYNLTTFPNTAPAAGVNLYGDLIDDPAGIIGTPLEKLTLHDIFVTFQRVAAQGGITLTNTPENNSGARTWQFSEAFGGEAWLSGPALAFTAVGGGSVTVGTVNYNKYRIVGKTIYWQVSYTNATIAGSPTLIEVISPVTSGGVNFPAPMQFTGVYNDGTSTDRLLIVGLNGGTLGSASVYFKAPGGFVNGATNQDLLFNIVAELP